MSEQSTCNNCSYSDAALHCYKKGHSVLSDDYCKEHRRYDQMVSLSSSDKKLILQALECAIELEVTNGNEDYAQDYMELYARLKGTRWVNVYEVTRHYGGPEEGGWWYDWYECIDSVEVEEEKAYELSQAKKEEYEDRKWGNIYSVRGGVDIRVLVEDWKAQSQTPRTPHYE
jgi:hypothetical protein